jgi:hypothetical protein
MAPKVRKEEPAGGKGRIKFRYTDPDRTMEFTIENVGGEGVKEALQTLGSAIAGRNLVEPKRLKNGKGATPEVETPEEETVEEEEVRLEQAAEDNDDEPADNDNYVAERRPRAAPRAPKFLSELNLTTATMQLDDFVKEKKPDNDLDKYTVIAVWYKQHFNTEEISIDHIFTAYDNLGWRSQMPGPDPSQTLRNLKSTKKNWFVSGSKRGFYKVNWNGEDAVNKMGAAKTT